MQKHCIGAILHCFCFLLLASSSNAQSYKLRLGAEVKDKIRPDRFIREDADGNIYVSGVSLKYKMLLPLGLINYYDADIRKFVKKYGSNLELVQEKPVLTPGSTVKSSPFKGKLNVTGALGYNTITIQNASLETVELWDRTIVILATNKKNAIEITAEEIDLETGVSFNSHKIANIKVPTGTKRRIDSIVVKKSPDGSRALIFCSGASRANGKKSLTFSATVINSDFSVLWQKQFNLPEAKKGLSYRSADLSNDGTLYILAKTAPNRRTKPTLSIISLNSETQAPVTRVINFGSLVVSA
ncbi:MAG: hypothetical protein EOO01_11375 [Chitinophagaceae bacterium]|nr:MAG: hypothetical protein EOO01_11375 [Chitinophagaceae bacterium]